MRAAGLVQQHVRRFHIAVQHPALVRVVDGPRHVGHQLGGRPRVVQIAAALLLQIAPLHQLHRKVVDPFDFADVVDRDNMRMIQSGNRDRLVAKPPLIVLARDPVRPDHLQGHDAIQADMASAKDNAHAAVRNCLAQFVRPKTAGLVQRADRLDRDRRRPRIDALVQPEAHLHLLAQAGRELREAGVDFLGRRRIPQLLPRTDLAIRQFQDQLRLPGQRRTQGQVVFHAQRLRRAPAERLVGQAQFEHVLRRKPVAAAQQGRHVRDCLAVFPSRQQLIGQHREILLVIGRHTSSDSNA
jgi:hypothetical protein